MTGYGFFVSNGGITYKGQFVDEKKDGFGDYKWTNGRRHVGWWKKGK